MSTFSVIIPCREMVEAENCVRHCLNLDFPTDKFEVIVIVDQLPEGMKHGDKRYGLVRYLVSGKCLPSHKRDLGIVEAKKEYVAFIDADAYPRRDWLYQAERHFNHAPLIVALCGAGILPPASSFMEHASDLVLQSLPFNYRVIPKEEQLVEDYPTFNLIMKASVAFKIGGFKCEYLTGEDTLICKKIIQAGHEIKYTPDLIVYHARRPLFRSFLRQYSIYGKHRGYFFKTHPETSRKFVYLIPSLGVLCLSAWLLLWGCVLLWSFMAHSLSKG